MASVLKSGSELDENRDFIKIKIEVIISEIKKSGSEQIALSCQNMVSKVLF